MDYMKLVNDLLAQGHDVDDIAKEFTEALNAVSATNKSKKEREKYITDARQAVIRDIGHGVFSYKTAAKVAIVAAADDYPNMELKDLQNYETATAAAMEATAGFNDDLSSGKDIFSSILNCLPSKPFEKTAETDEEKIERFLRALG